MSYKSGFSGHDSMREKAEKEFRAELQGLNMHAPQSSTNPSRQKMRMYAKGGRVHPLNEDQKNLRLPKRAKPAYSNQPNFEDVEHKADGGRVQKKSIGGIFKKVSRFTPMGFAATKAGLYAEGGHVENKSLGGKLKAKPKNTHVDYAHGGRMVKRCDDGHYSVGGNVRKAGKGKLGLFAHGGRVQRNPDEAMLRGEPLRKGFHSAYGLASGGKVKSKILKVLMGPRHFSEGGEMSRTPELNESSRRPVRKSFGSKVGNVIDRGTSTVKRTANKVGSAAKAGYSAARSDISRGASQVASGAKKGVKAVRSVLGFKKGGAVNSEGVPMRGERPARHLSAFNYESNMRGEHGRKGRGYAEGGTVKKAAGGVGKIRHEAASRSGKPLKMPRNTVKRGGGC